jgi:hypothetical protein
MTLAWVALGGNLGLIAGSALLIGAAAGDLIALGKR